MSAEKDDREDRERKKHVKPLEVTPEASAPDLSDWMERLFDKEFPAKLHLIEIHGKTGILSLGHIHDHHSFTVATNPNKEIEKPKKEFFVSLSNRFIAAAQRDCDMRRRPQNYVVEAFNSLKSADSYSRFPLPMQPKLTYGKVERNGLGKYFGNGTGNGEVDDDEDGQDRFGNDKLLRRLVLNLKAEEWREEQFATAIGGMFQFLESAAIRSSEQSERLLQRNFELVGLLEQALSKQTEREIAARKELLWVDTVTEARTMVKGLLPQVVNKAVGHQVLPVTHTTERMVLEAFINSLTQQQIDTAFGKWTKPAKQGERAEQIEPGIFSVEQMLILETIAEGSRDPNDIDLLLEGDYAITPDQLVKAQPLFRESQILPLMALFKTRRELRQKAAEEKNEQARHRK